MIQFLHDCNFAVDLLEGVLWRFFDGDTASRSGPGHLAVGQGSACLTQECNLVMRVPSLKSDVFYHILFIMVDLLVCCANYFGWALENIHENVQCASCKQSFPSK